MADQYRVFYELTVERNDAAITDAERKTLAPIARTLAMLQYATTGEKGEFSAFLDEARSLAAICADTPMRA